MPHRRDYLLVLDRIRVALEATCDALLTLQSIDVLANVPEEVRGDSHIAHAVADLRHAIDELRGAQAHGQSGLALGFVLAQDRPESGSNGRVRQSRPRRTA